MERAKMSETLNSLFMSPFDSLIDRFEQQKKRYALLGENHGKAVADLRRKCKESNISDQQTNLMLRQIVAMGVRLEESSSAYSMLTKKINQLTELYKIFFSKSGPIRPEQYTWSGKPGDWKVLKLEEMLDTCIYGSMEKEEMDKQNRYLSEFQAELGVCYNRCIHALDKLLGYQRQEEEALRSIFLPINQSCLPNLESIRIRQPAPNLQPSTSPIAVRSPAAQPTEMIAEDPYEGMKAQRPIRMKNNPAAP